MPAVKTNIVPEPLPPEIERTKMSAENMVKILTALADKSQILPGMVLITYKDVEMQCLYDEHHDRMRIIATVSAVGDVTPEQFSKTMEANFHSALDARYAVNEGVLYAAFIHPLSSLTRTQIKNAMHQVATLKTTFGTHYTSSGLTFGGGGDPLQFKVLFDLTSIISDFT